jgi:hypothetical protein
MAYYYRRMQSNGASYAPGVIEKNLGYVFPLAIQNRKVLTQATSLNRPSSLSAHFIKTGQSATFGIDASPDRPSFSIYVADRLISTHLCGTLSLEQFVEVAVSILREMRIRLD